MNSKDFQKAVVKTESKPEVLNFSLPGLKLLLGSAVLMTDIIDLAKKTMFYGKELDRVKFNNLIGELQNRLGDIAVRSIERRDDAPIPSMTMPNMRVAHGSIGMFTESGELLSAVIKQIETGELDLVNVAEETGDSDWYKALIHDETGVTEEATREKVIAKLQDKQKGRYKSGTFSNDAANNRDLDAERALLEGEAA